MVTAVLAAAMRSLKSSFMWWMSRHRPLANLDFQP
jgi:hypothetical protein